MNFENKIPTKDAEDNKQYLLLGSRECPILFGYKKGDYWYANSDDKHDYSLSRFPEFVVDISGNESSIADKEAELVKTEYQLVKLSSGFFQVAYLERDYHFKKGNDWHLDVFGEVIIEPEEIIGKILD